VCWSQKLRILKNLIRNGRKCQLVAKQGFRSVRCLKKAEGKIVRRYNRQGQSCIVYRAGLNRWTRCSWGRNFPGAKIVRKFNKGTDRCTVWKSSKNAERTICWSSKSKVLRRFLRNGRRCALWSKAGRQYMKCAKGKIQGRVVKKWER
jgi:hypothetical protein